MSIHQINKLFQNKGCNIAMSVVLLLSVASFLSVGGMRGCGKEVEQNTSLLPVATIGDYQITKEDVLTAVDRQMQQFQGAELPNTIKLSYEGREINRRVIEGLTLLYAKQQGVDFPNDAVKQRIVASETDAYKEDLITHGKMAPNASQQEFENAYKAGYGRSWVDNVKEIDQAITDRMKTPEGKAVVDASVAAMLLGDKLKPKFMPTEDSVKEGYYTYHFKVIDFASPKASPKDLKAKADQALKEIKGGLSFEAAMDKYATTPPSKGKKASDQTTDLFKSSLESDPLQKPLLALKPGQLSDVIVTRSGPMIYKLIGSGIVLPKDFATQKTTLMNDKARNDAAKYITDQAKKLDTPANVVWQSEGFHVLYDLVTQATSDQKKPLGSIVDRALDAQGDPLGGQEAVGAAMLALPQATQAMPPAKAADLKIKVLTAYVALYPEVETKIQLAELYIDKGDAVNTPLALTDAANQNAVHADPPGKTDWDTLNNDIKKATAKKLLKPEDVKSLSVIYAAWLGNFTAAEAEAKKDAAAQKEAQDALEKANKKAAPPVPPQKSQSTPKDQTPPKKGTSSILHPSDNVPTGKH